MLERTTVARRVLQFNDELAAATLDLPGGFRIVNPFTGPQKGTVRQTTTAFYQKYYDDDKPRRLILGSSPARRGTAVTGVPFEDAEVLESDTGLGLDGYGISRNATGFIHDVIRHYGGRDKFYADFCMSFVCPLGVVKTSSKGNEVNCNYYESKELREYLRSFIVGTLKRQLEFATDTSVCYCIGSGENFKFLSKLNKDHGFFQEILPLEHPRFVTQYNLGRRDDFIDKYISALRGRETVRRTERAPRGLRAGGVANRLSKRR